MRTSLILVAVLFSCSVGAAGPQLTVTNASERQQITLSVDPVVINADGNIELKCADPENCSIGPGSVAVGDKPGDALIELRTTAGAALPGNVIQTGVDFDVRVTPPTTNVASTCVLTTSPAQTSTSGLSLAKLSFHVTQQHRLRAANAGTISFTVECFKSAAESSVALADLTVEQSVEPPPPDDECEVSKESLRGPNGEETQDYRLFKPAGFLELERSWAQIFPGKVYPNSEEFPYPVGSWSQTSSTLSGSVRYSSSPTMTGRYISIPITAGAAPMGLQWIDALPRSSIGYAPTRGAGAIMVGLSTCRGDFRIFESWQNTAPVNDPTAVYACRVVGSSEKTLIYGTGAQCNVTAGKRYYINIVMQDPRDGFLLPTRTSCFNTSSGVCEASFIKNL